MRILFSGGGGAGNEALWRLLRERHELFFGDADIDPIHPLIPQSRRISLPWASAEDFVVKTRSLCVEYRIDLLTPGVDEELPLIAASEKEFLPTKLFLPEKEYVEHMLDKLEMAVVLQKRGIPVPITIKASEFKGDFLFPCIIKPRRGRGSRGVAILHDAGETQCSIQMLGAKADEYVLQERMEGSEYTVQMIADESGQLRAIVPVRVFSKRGITISAAVDPDDAVLNMCCLLHEAIPTKGCYNIQLILSDGGRARPFEINPRISTTFCLAVFSGIDPFHLFFQPNVEKKLIIGRQGISLRRYWNNVITG